MPDIALEVEPLSAPTTKCCRRCGLSKDENEFYRWPASRGGGLMGMCKECKKDQSRKRHHANRDVLIVQMRRNYEANKEARSEYMREWREKNAEALRLKKKEYAEANKDSVKARIADWRRKNRARLGAHEAGRRAAKRKASPAWRNMDAVREIYATAKRMSANGENAHHVDHIVPMKSPMVQGLDGNFLPKKKFVGPLMPIVQGLHVEANLRPLVWGDNLSKSNRVWPDMPNIRL